jgi:hypothetical protein
MTAPSPFFESTFVLRANNKETFTDVCHDIHQRVSAFCAQRGWSMRRPEPKVVRVDYTDRSLVDVTMVALVNTLIPCQLQLGDKLHVEFYLRSRKLGDSATGYLTVLCRSYPVAVDRQMGSRSGRPEPLYPDELFEQIHPLLRELTDTY